MFWKQGGENEARGVRWQEKLCGGGRIFGGLPSHSFSLVSSHFYALPEGSQSLHGRRAGVWLSPLHVGWTGIPEACGGGRLARWTAPTLRPMRASKTDLPVAKFSS